MTSGNPEWQARRDKIAARNQTLLRILGAGAVVAVVMVGGVLAAMFYFSGNPLRDPMASTGVPENNLEERLRPSVALVIPTVRCSFPDRTVEFMISQGSGFLVGTNGGLLTNHHVIAPFLRAQANASQLSRLVSEAAKTPATVEAVLLVFIDQKQYDATISTSDQDVDCALLKVDLHGTKAQGLRVSPKAGDAQPLCHVGDDVFAVGFPAKAQVDFSESEAVSNFVRKAGQARVAMMLSEKERQYYLTKGVVSRIVTDPQGIHHIQHDALISGGSSGGPLIDARGDVIGINAAVSVEKVAGSDVEQGGFSIAVSIKSVLPVVGDKLRD